MKTGSSRQKIMASRFNQKAVGNKLARQKEQSRFGKGYSNDPIGKAFKPNPNKGK